jgi:hypothetical protein
MLEQELASTNLLFKEGVNGSYEFIHDTWRQFFTAKYWARELNEGRITHKDLHKQLTYRLQPFYAERYYHLYWLYDVTRFLFDSIENIDQSIVDIGNTLIDRAMLYVKMHSLEQRLRQETLDFLASKVEQKCLGLTNFCRKSRKKNTDWMPREILYDEWQGYFKYLSVLASKRATEVLANYLLHPVEGVGTGEPLYALGKINNKLAVEGIRQYLSLTMVKDDVLELLGEMGTKDSLKVVAEYFQDDRKFFPLEMIRDKFPDFEEEECYEMLEDNYKINHASWKKIAFSQLESKLGSGLFQQLIRNSADLVDYIENSDLPEVKPKPRKNLGNFEAFMEEVSQDHFPII